MKKYWKLIVLISLIVIIVIIYFVLKNKQSNNDNEQKIKINSEYQSEKLVNERIYFPQIIGNQLFYYYFNEVFNLEDRNKGITLINVGPKEMLLSPDLKYAILQITNNEDTFALQNNMFYNKSLIDSQDYYWLFDVKNKTAKLLDQNIVSIFWSPDADKIIYSYGNNDGSTSLNIANPDGSNWQTISKLNKEIIFTNNYKNITLLYTEAVGDTGNDGKDIRDFDLYQFNWNNNKLSKLDSQPQFLDASYCGSTIVKSYYKKNESSLATISYTINNNVEIVNESEDYQTFVCSNKLLISKNLNEKNKILIYDFETKEKKETIIKYNSELETGNLIGIIESSLYFTADDYLYKTNLE